VLLKLLRYPALELFLLGLEVLSGAADDEELELVPIEMPRANWEFDKPVAALIDFCNGFCCCGVLARYIYYILYNNLSI
jgi:hypothetical protein